MLIVSQHSAGVSVELQFFKPFVPGPGQSDSRFARPDGTSLSNGVSGRSFCRPVSPKLSRAAFILINQNNHFIAAGNVILPVLV
jgi:hypothetical protein